MGLEYYVYVSNFNDNSIEKFNIFNHSRFLEDVKKDKYRSKSKDDFIEKLRCTLFYHYCSKCEWETVITPWVPHITTNELNRLNLEYEESMKKYDREPYRLYINPEIAEKIDVYSQVMLNWELFVDYVWHNISKTKLLKNI